MKKIDTKSIALMGLLIAVEVVLTRFLAFETNYLRISIAFIPLMVMGHLFSPAMAGLGGVVADIIGMIIFPKAPYFPGFSLNAFLTPFIYSLFFYKKEITLKRNVMAQVVVMLSISLFLTPIWLKVMYNVPYFELMPLRILKECITLPVNVMMSHYLFNQTRFGAVVEGGN